jgi:hypothetical protein
LAESTVTPIPHLSGPANAALQGAGITSLEGLAGHSAKELLALHGFGPKALRILGPALPGSPSFAP